MEQLRTSCSGRFLSAAKPGVYRYEPKEAEADRMVNAVKRMVQF
jgi:hypothetical protein